LNGWLEVFKEIIKTVPVVRIQSECILLAQCLSDSSERLLSRKIGALAICILVTVIPPADYIKTYTVFINKLSEDSNWEVREVIAEKIPFLCENLGTFLTQSNLFDILIKLTNDKQKEVNLMAFESLGLSIKYLGKNNIWFEKTIKKMTEILNNPDPEILDIFIKNCGKILDGITKEKLEKSNELSIMMQTIILSSAEKNLEKYAVNLAQNLPAILFVFGPEKFCDSNLFILIEKIINENIPVLAKIILASCFHELIKLFGYELSIERLPKYFFALFDSKEMLILQELLKNIDQILEMWCENPKKEFASKFIENYFEILIKVHKNTQIKSWRIELIFLEKLDYLTKFFNSTRILNIILPICKEVFKNSPKECKIEVCDLLALILTDICPGSVRTEIHNLLKNMATSLFYKDRITFLEFINCLFKCMSKHYFKEHFQYLTLLQGEDKVVSVLWKFCEISIEIKKNLLPDDIKTLDKLFNLLTNISKSTKCKSLQEKAIITLTQIKSIEISKLIDQDEEYRYQREKEISKTEKKELEETKKTSGIIKPLKNKNDAIILINGNTGNTGLLVHGAKIKKQNTAHTPPLQALNITHQDKPKSTGLSHKLTKGATICNIKKEAKNTGGSVLIQGIEKQLHPKISPKKKK